MLLLCHVAIWTICFDGRHVSVQKFNDYNDLVVCWLLLHFELGPSNDPMQQKVCPYLNWKLKKLIVCDYPVKQVVFALNM